MADSSTPGSATTSVSRAKELTAELRRLQEHVESLDAALLQDNVAKVGRRRGTAADHRD